MFLHDLAQVARWIIPDKLESQHSLHPLDILSLSREVIRLIRMVHKKKQPCNGLRSYSFCAFYVMWKRDALWPALTRQTKTWGQVRAPPPKFGFVGTREKIAAPLSDSNRWL